MPPTRFTYDPWWSAGSRPVEISLEGYRDADLIAYTIRTQRAFWELDLLEHVAMTGPRGGLYLDVGGNIGNHAVFFGLFCADHVATFEPHPDLLPILRRNLGANNLSQKSTVLPVALGEHESRGSMALREGFEQNIGASHVSVDDQKSKNKSPISVRPLDTVVAELTERLHLPITFLKIDVEGMELQVLRGAGKTLAEQRPQLLVELITPESHAAASEILTPLGYREAARLSDPPSVHFIEPSRHKLRPNLWEGGTYYSHQIHMLEKDIRGLTPEDALVILADSDELALGGRVAGRERLHFTEQGGQYFGPPATDDHAISQLINLRLSGATHFAVAFPSFWYLDRYQQFAGHLRANSRLLARTPRVILFQLH